MTTRTITVNTPEETEVQICDECGLGEDAGKLVEFSPEDPELDADLHYHRDCLREKNGNPQTLSEAFHEAVGAEMEHEIALVLTRFGLQVLLASLTFFSMGAVVSVGHGVSFVPVGIWSTGALGILFVLLIGRDNGQKTAEEMV